MIKKILSKVFGFFVDKRNDKFDNTNEITKCNIPVISVGNLSVGGTGKTPFVQMLTKYFLSKEYKPGIVGKGYKRDGKGEVIVGNKNGALVNASTGGDEMVLLADSLKVPVVANDSKTLAALSIQDKFDIDLIIVDDGFQHRQLHRDLDIVLIDKETNDNPELMPKGRLREPISSLKRADIICFMGNFKISEEIKQNISPESVIISVKPIKSNPYYLKDKQFLKIKEIKGNSINIFAFAGIAKPDRFFEMTKEMGFNCVSSHSYDDHHNYNSKDIEFLIQKCKENNCDNLATTEKDAAKLIEYIDILNSNNINCIVFPIALSIVNGKVEFFKLIGRKINKSIKTKRSLENGNLN